MGTYASYRGLTSLILIKTVAVKTESIDPPYCDVGAVFQLCRIRIQQSVPTPVGRIKILLTFS